MQTLESVLFLVRSAVVALQVLAQCRSDCDAIIDSGPGDAERAAHVSSREVVMSKSNTRFLLVSLVTLFSLGSGFASAQGSPGLLPDAPER